MDFHTLETTSLGVMHRAFVDAFSEYQVPMDMPLEKLEFLMATRSYRADLSWGAFDNGVLAGFVLTGYRDQPRPTAYDVATGVTRAYQSRGLGSQLVGRVLGHAAAHGVERFVLEVLEDNRAAQGLYSRWGFGTTRRLNCYHVEPGSDPLPSGFTVSREDALPPEAEAWNGFVPTWQNSRQVWEARPQDHVVWVLRHRGQAVGSLLGHPGNRTVLMWGVAPSAQGLEDALAARFLGEKPGPGRYLNVEKGSETDLRLGRRSAPFVRQWEQELVLGRPSGPELPPTRIVSKFRS